MKKLFLSIQTLCFVTIGLLSWDAAYAACPLPIQTPFAAVALLTQKSLNKIDDKTPPTEISSIAVYDAPLGQIIAQLKITYDPKKQITARLIQNQKSYPFTPTFYDRDFGYGPWFHATLLEQRDAWKRIALPQITSGWINLPGAEVFQILDEKDSVYSFKDRSIRILESNNSGLVIRDEQPADMWCEAGTPPPLANFKKEFIPLTQLYDDQCNLLLSPKYTRGC